MGGLCLIVSFVWEMRVWTDIWQSKQQSVEQRCVWRPLGMKLPCGGTGFFAGDSLNGPVRKTRLTAGRGGMWSFYSHRRPLVLPTNIFIGMAVSIPLIIITFCAKKNGQWAKLTPNSKQRATMKDNSCIVLFIKKNSDDLVGSPIISKS